jgi:hypothetical protein
MSKESKQRQIAEMEIMEYLNPFIPLVANTGAEIRIEAQTNKEFHLGPKEYDYIPTIAGHVPIK